MEALRTFQRNVSHTCETVVTEWIMWSLKNAGFVLNELRSTLSYLLCDPCGRKLVCIVQDVAGGGSPVETGLFSSGTSCKVSGPSGW